MGMHYLSLFFFNLYNNWTNILEIIESNLNTSVWKYLTGHIFWVCGLEKYFWCILILIKHRNFSPVTSKKTIKTLSLAAFFALFHSSTNTTNLCVRRIQQSKEGAVTVRTLNLWLIYSNSTTYTFFNQGCVS